jgi:hypothetical protein
MLTFVMLSVVMVGIILMSVIILIVTMLGVIILSTIMPIVIQLSAVMLSIASPLLRLTLHVEQKLMLSCNFRCDQIYTNQCYAFGHTLLLLKSDLGVQQTRLRC